MNTWTIQHNGTEYTAELKANGSVVICADGIYAGSGWLRFGMIECPVDIPAEVYESLYDAMFPGGSV